MRDVCHTFVFLSLEYVDLFDWRYKMFHVRDSSVAAWRHEGGRWHYRVCGVCATFMRTNATRSLLLWIWRRCPVSSTSISAPRACH